MEEHYVLEYSGFCPICEQPARFAAKDPWLRDNLLCRSCPNGSLPRERALALALSLYSPGWRAMRIHESSPCDRGVSRKLRLECPGYVATQFCPGAAPGTVRGPHRCEDLERLSFADGSFDLFVSLDVFEHLFDPRAAAREIHRTLVPGGLMLCTWPVRKGQAAPLEPRATRDGQGRITHLKEPEIHGNPVDESGSLVTVDYGYDIHQELAGWADFDVSVLRFADRTHGILGEYTDVILGRKR